MRKFNPSYRLSSYYFLFIVVLFFCSKTGLPCYAFMDAAFTPRFSIKEQYEENFERADETKDAFWLTKVSPGFSLELISPMTDLDMDLEAEFPFVHETKNQNSFTESTQYQGKCLWSQELAPYLSFDLMETLVTSEDRVFHDGSGLEQVFKEKGVYYNNKGQASISYQFGSKDLITLGYRNKYLYGSLETFEDSKSHEGFLNAEKWVSERFGARFTTRINHAKFKEFEKKAWRGSKNFHEYEGGVNLKYLWNLPFYLIYFQYNLIKKDFCQEVSESNKIDFLLHKGLAGFDFNLSPQTDLNIEGGYFVLEPKDGHEKANALYSIGLKTQMEHTTVLIKGSGGYKEDYFSAENLGSLRYMQGLFSVNYNLNARIDLFGSLFYEKEDFWADTGQSDEDDKRVWQTNAKILFSMADWFKLYLDGGYSHKSYINIDRSDDVWRTDTGFDIYIGRRFIVSLKGVHSESISDDPEYSFRDNKVVLTLTSIYPFSF